MASSYLSRNFTSGNRQKYTISTWLKRSSVANPSQSVISAGSGGDKNYLHFENGTLRFESYDGAFNFQLLTNRVFRDTSAWYHIVVAYDSAQATASNRIKMYINGVQETSFAQANYPTQNYNSVFNTSGYTNFISKESDNNNYFDGLMTHTHLIDGLAYDADTFGETDSTTGIWKPKTAPSVTYGTNGFFLKGENSSALGTDSSGNSNNFTVNGTPTQTVDTPANVFATLNPLDKYYSQATFSNGNNQSAMTGSYETYTTSTLGVSKGKYYCEGKVAVASAFCMLGIVGRYPTASSHHVGYYNDGYGYNGGSSTLWTNNSSSSYGNTFTTNDIIGIAVDLDNNKLYFSKNGVFQNSGDPTSGATGTGAVSILDPDNTTNGSYLFGFGCRNNDGVTWQTNFGNGFFGTTAVASAQNPDDGIGIFEYDVPAGYRALCTKSINAQEYS